MGKHIPFSANIAWVCKMLNAESDLSQDTGHFLSYLGLWHLKVPLELPFHRRPALHRGPSYRISEEQCPLENAMGC